MNTPAQRLAALAAQAARTGLPADLRETSVSRLVDLVGNSIAALDCEPAHIVHELTRAWGGVSATTAIGSAQRLPAPSGALVNGTLAHCLDFDDSHLPSVLHPSAAVIPAALAVAEEVDAGGAALLDAITIGVEVTCRLGMAGFDPAVKNSVFFDRGQHATAICGTVGAAVAAGMLRGLDAEALTSVIGIACSMGSGVIEANRTGGTIKRVHCGWAAHSGVVAADLAGHGLTGPPTVLEGRFGFLNAFCGDRADLGQLTDGLGERWEAATVFFKPYPCNHFTHPGVDAALRMRAAGIDPDAVESLVLGVPAPVVHTIGEPTEEKRRPRSGYHAAFSGPFTVAAALLGGGGLGLSHEDFTDSAARDPRRLALAAKVRVVADDECGAVFPRQMPSVLTATLADGSRHTERVPVSLGGPGNPMSQEQLTAKFRLNATRAIPEDQADRIADLIWALPTGTDVSALTDALRSTVRRPIPDSVGTTPRS
ncbi:MULTISPECIES: MmgE/PrpD family protein [Streptomycetaceae]|uniref:Putative MmgE/PrpD family protein n=1 Tax=Streptantibioticus cattleyicolor (strain ATCC 35852 / DSM 46488 / JCM 4925 / NBRC 14057 / NRRL 8057) TaxID=1003195 RepID=F8JUW3_STREN|nr:MULTISPECIES: MmgE/PrpD family protein [Streptomycetaceae]AEW98125.1 putative MmgE/PrpD family protein [Streptantibioticus cattleyicolor NRRL 8057 = DSM 46488]MYS62514.1 MmgE/PrpD family protein [Streptomyces sp. SID5468]CCB78438.1 putative MmgE/PrpD family protein [Streptantibioticus cattleyicolor NRRL 8057 = DSM 46488]